MKKIISILLSVLLVLSFSACADDKKVKEAEVDLEYFADLGQIKESPYKLGADPDEINEELSSADESAASAGEEFAYNVTEGEKTVLIDSDTFSFYYEKAKKDKGISAIVSYDEAYGFTNSNNINDVKAALEPYKYSEETATDDNIFFISGITDGTVLKYTFDNIEIIFLFQENMFFAAAIYDTDNWTV